MNGRYQKLPKGEREALLKILDKPYSLEQKVKDWKNLIDEVEEIGLDAIRRNSSLAVMLHNKYDQFSANMNFFFHMTVSGRFNRSQIYRFIRKLEDGNFTMAELEEIAQRP